MCGTITPMSNERDDTKAVKPQILLTNDDGIDSPGLWAAAAALSELGYVHVAAPREQYSGAGRSLPRSSDGVIRLQEIGVNGQSWQVYAVGGTPAQAVLYALLEILPDKPALVVSGINYGENVGTGITVSGTVGAALEAASMGIPSLAVSLETEKEHHLSYSTEVDFTTAAYFTYRFAKLMLEKRMPPDVDLLKVDVPADASLETPWEVTRLARSAYYLPVRPTRETWDIPAGLDYTLAEDIHQQPVDSDSYAVRIKRVVSVTPLSLDMTSRIELKEFEDEIRRSQSVETGTA
jgi:5'-nucleotidase